MISFTVGRIGSHADGELAPDVAELLSGLAELKQPPMESLPAKKARERANAARDFGGPLLPVADVADVAVPGPGGDVPLRIYRPAGDGPFPVVFFIHGGGWVVCNNDTHEDICRFLCNRGGFVVTSVDYRLAPEHPFPVPVEDCDAAYAWVRERIGGYAGTPDRIAVCGDSAGGNLSTVIARHAAAAGNGPAAQILFYPAVDLSRFDRSSHDAFKDGYFLTMPQLEWFRSHYLGGTDPSHPDVSPVYADDLSVLPPAYVATAGCDVLRDEGEEYARLMHEAGVPVVCERYTGMIHAFVAMNGKVAGGVTAMERGIKFLEDIFYKTNIQHPTSNVQRSNTLKCHQLPRGTWSGYLDVEC